MCSITTSVQYIQVYTGTVRSCMLVGGYIKKTIIDRYKGHSEITDTPLAFWTLGEIKSSPHSKVKRGDRTGRKREKVGQLCPSTETGAVQG